jgi:hypothetical protein
MFELLESDPRLAIIKHFRDKKIAHSAESLQGVRSPRYGEMFNFAREVATVMEKFAIGVGVTTEKLSETTDWRMESSQKFWEPWELLRN